MPLYEYKCSTCGERVEIIQRVSDPPYDHCPKCGGEMKKQISSPAIQFKGSGFYITDYAKKSTSEAGSKSSSSSGESSASEAKPSSDSKSSESKSTDSSKTDK